jgi:GT2 family glycosyltransferase
VTDQAPEISVVIPTYNRADALRLNFPYVLAMDDVGEIVVVIDASSDGTESLLASYGDDRVREIKHPDRRGSQAARKTGVKAARGEWVLMLDDDCAMLPDFAQALLAAARRCNADIVSAPWLPIEPDEDMAGAIARGRSSARGWVGLRTSPLVFPDRDLETPFLTGNVLINRRVFERVGYDEKLTRNAWREETALYLDACAAGFRCLLTPDTASFQLGQWDGGQRLPPLSYEWYALRNNWRFLWRYRDDLRARGEIRGPVTAEAQFLGDRATYAVKGYVGARLQARRNSR